MDLRDTVPTSMIFADRYKTKTQTTQMKEKPRHEKPFTLKYNKFFRPIFRGRKKKKGYLYTCSSPLPLLRSYLNGTHDTGSCKNNN